MVILSHWHRQWGDRDRDDRAGHDASWLPCPDVAVVAVRRWPLLPHKRQWQSQLWSIATATIIAIKEELNNNDGSSVRTLAKHKRSCLVQLVRRHRMLDQGHLLYP